MIVPTDLEINARHDDVKEMGICTLDTRDIKHSMQTWMLNISQILSTYSSFLIHHKTASKRFRNGESERMARHNVQSLLEKVFRTGTPLAQSAEPRPVILVAHEI